MKTPANESTNMWSIIMILVGIILILAGKVISLHPTISGLLEFTGSTFIGVFAVSFFYQTLIAEKHFIEFKQLLKSQLKELDSIQSRCNKLGILELFENRDDYQRQYPLMQVIEECPEQEKIICVARSLFHLLNKTGELKKGLEEGKVFRFACVDPDKISPSLQKISQMYKSDVDSALMSLKGLIDWAIQKKAKGTIELSYHNVDLPDSVFLFTTEKYEKRLVWDLGFGRDLNQKRVIILNSEAPLGKDLKDRYSIILNDSICKIKYSDGNVTCNELNWAFADNLDSSHNKAN